MRPMFYVDARLEVISVDLATVRADVRRLHEALERARFSRRTGDSAPSFGELLALFPHASSEEALALVREEGESATGRRRLRFERLAETITRNRHAAVAEPSRQRAAALWGTTLRGPPAHPTPSLRELVRVLASTPDRNAREQLVIEAGSHGDALLSSWAHGVEALGGGKLSLAKEAADAKALLGATGDMYADVLGWWLRKSAGVKAFPRGATAHDVLRAVRNLPFDDAARASDVKALPSGFGALRLAQSVRWVDGPVGEEGGKVFAPDAPSDVRAVLHAGGGFAAARATLRAAGSAWHWAGVDANAPSEDRLLGAPAIRTATGRVFGWLLIDRAWSRKRLGVVDPDWTRVLALADLFGLRLEAALVVVAAEALESGATAARFEEWAEYLSRETCAAWPRALLACVLPAPERAAEHLASWRLGQALRRTLIERFDEDWWANPRSGDFLSSYFLPGGLHTVQGLGEEFGLPQLEEESIENVWLSALD